MRAFKTPLGIAVLASGAMSVALLPALAGCGSTNKATTTTATSSAAAPTTSGELPAVKPATYEINLTHVSGASGAPNASGLAVLSVRSPSDELCWSISPIKSFTVSPSTATPTLLIIQPTPNGTPRSPGFPLGLAYKSSGCTHTFLPNRAKRYGVPPPIVLGVLEAHPQRFYLSVYNTRSGEAVRGQM
jgi:hypothetical protein